jgi:hypothetical protein
MECDYRQVWTDNRIYCTFWYSAWLHFTVHYYKHSCPRSRLQCRHLLTAAKGGLPLSPGFSNYPQPQLLAFNSNRSRLNARCSVTLCNSTVTKSKSKLCYERRSVEQSLSMTSINLGLKTRFLLLSFSSWPPLWSSGQSSWLQIWWPGFDSRQYQKKSSGSGTGSTQPCKYNWGATW